MKPRRPVDIRAMLSVVESAPMTRAEIARRTGLSRTHVTRLATGERGARAGYDTVEAVRRLYDACRVLPTGNK